MATQKDLDAGLQVDGSALVDVKWLDACAHMNVEELDGDNLLELLCPTHTLGKVVVQDEKVLVVATNISAANGIDLIAIPVKWIESIKMMEAS